MSFTIEHDKSHKREDFGDYKYRILRNGLLFASYWHDYRGDDHGITFRDGTTESAPLGRMIDFIEGGGLLPLKLSAKAVALLEQHIK